MKKVVFDEKAFEQLYSLGLENPKKMVKTLALIDAARRTPFSGIGKPEPLKHALSNHWSRRIDEKHRLVYSVSDDVITILSCKFHYEE